MTALDIITLLLIGIAAAFGFMRGFVSEALSLVAWVLQAVQVLAPARTVVITGHQSDAVRSEISTQFPNTEFALQTAMNGTGHAVQQTQNLLGDFQGDILVTCGDVPLLRPRWRGDQHPFLQHDA